MRQLRITLTGASAVGKTTLALALAERLGCGLIPELARNLCEQMGYDRIGDIPDQEKFKMDVLELQTAAENAEPGSFVADRGALDVWVLWQRWNICSAMSHDTEALYDKVRSHSSTYTHLIYIPPLFAAQEDRFRWTDASYRRQVDRLVRMSLYDLNLLDRTITISSSTVQERVDEVLQHLS